MSELGYEYHLMRGITVESWLLVQKRITELFKRFGFRDRSHPFGSREGNHENLAFLKRYNQGDRTELITNKPESLIGQEINSISVNYDYPNEESKVPCVIRIRPYGGSWEKDGTKKAMETIEQLEKEGVLITAGFKVLYKCLSGVTSSFISRGEQIKISFNSAIAMSGPHGSRR